MEDEVHRKLPKIVDEDQYLCSVVFFSSASHQILTIEAEHIVTSDVLYLDFWMVKYYSGPVYWQGLRLSKEPPEEAVKILIQLLSPDIRELLNDDVKQQYAKMDTLYRIQPATYQPEVKILAADVRLDDKPRVRLKPIIDEDDDSQ